MDKLPTFWYTDNSSISRDVIKKIYGSCSNINIEISEYIGYDGKISLTTNIDSFINSPTYISNQELLTLSQDSSLSDNISLDLKINLADKSEWIPKEGEQVYVSSNEITDEIFEMLSDGRLDANEGNSSLPTFVDVRFATFICMVKNRFMCLDNINYDSEAVESEYADNDMDADICLISWNYARNIIKPTISRADLIAKLQEIANDYTVIE